MDTTNTMAIMDITVDGKYHRWPKPKPDLREELKLASNGYDLNNDINSIINKEL